MDSRAGTVSRRRSRLRNARVRGRARRARRAANISATAARRVLGRAGPGFLAPASRRREPTRFGRSGRDMGRRDARGHGVRGERATRARRGRARARCRATSSRRSARARADRGAGAAGHLGVGAVARDRTVHIPARVSHRPRHGSESGVCARIARAGRAFGDARDQHENARARAQVLGLGWAGRLVSSAVVPETPSQPMPEAGAVQADPQPGTIAMYPVSELPRVFNKEGYQPRGDLLRDLCSQGYPSDDCRGLDARSAARQAPTSASPDK